MAQVFNADTATEDFAADPAPNRTDIDLAHCNLDRRELIGTNMNTAHHRKQSCLVVVVHLNFSDVRSP